MVSPNKDAKYYYELRQDITAYIKMIIYLRWKNDPGFLEECQLSAWLPSDFRERLNDTPQTVLEKARRFFRKITDRHIFPLTSLHAPPENGSESESNEAVCESIIDHFQKFHKDVDFEDSLEGDIPLFAVIKRILNENPKDKSWYSKFDWVVLPNLRKELNSLQVESIDKLIPIRIAENFSGNELRVLVFLQKNLGTPRKQSEIQKHCGLENQSDDAFRKMISRIKKKLKEFPYQIIYTTTKSVITVKLESKPS